MGYTRENFEKWQSQWDKAVQEKVFADTSNAPKDSGSGYTDFFGVQNNAVGKIIQDADTEYWNKVYRMSSHMGQAPNPLEEEEHDPKMQGDSPVTISEDAPVENKELAPTTKPDGKSVSKITDELGGLANPVRASTRGVDANNRVTPSFAGGEELIELHKMKEQLQKLEDKLAADPMVENKGAKKVMSQIDALWKQIDELSNTLSPDFVRDYLS